MGGPDPSVVAVHDTDPDESIVLFHQIGVVRRARHEGVEEGLHLIDRSDADVLAQSGPDEVDADRQIRCVRQRSLFSQVVGPLAGQRDQDGVDLQGHQPLAHTELVDELDEVLFVRGLGRGLERSPVSDSDRRCARTLDLRTETAGTGHDQTERDGEGSDRS